MEKLNCLPGELEVIGRPDPYDSDYACFVKAKDKGEPTFTLRAQDASAHFLVTMWANMNAPALGQNHPKILQARQIAESMRLWPNKKQAD